MLALARTSAAVLLTSTTAVLAAPPAGARDGDSETLDPTVVTAERLAEGAPGFLSDADLGLFQAGSVDDLAGLVPGFHVVSSDSRGYGDVISMRGAANTLFFSPPAVALLVDEVPMGDVFSYPSVLLELAGVGILRGPQGAGFGRNAPAGLVEMWTPRPGQRLAAGIEAEYGSYDAFGVRVATGGPLAECLSHTLQLYHQQRDGYLSNPTLGRATDDRSLDGGMVNLFWRPSADTEWRLRILGERADDGSQRLSRLGSPDPFVVESDLPGEFDLSRYQVSVHGTRETGCGRFKSITAYQGWKLDPSVVDLDLMNSPPGFGSSSTIIQEQEMFTQELRWESPDDAGPWSWRGGLFVMNKRTDGDATRAFPVEAAPGFYLPFSERTLYNLEEWNFALYGRGALAVNERLAITAGARIDYADHSIDRIKTDSFMNSSTVVGDDAEWLFSPELGASWQLADPLRLFARSAVGVKPAGFSAFASTPASARYDDEVGWNNEIGIEGRWPDERLACSLAGFWNRIDDYQVNRPDIASTDFLIVNADRVRSIGVEAEGRWQPLDGLTLQGSAGYVDATFRSYVDPLLPGVFYDGNSVPYVPEFTGSLGGRFEFGNGFYLQTAVRVSGPTHFNEANTARYRQGTWWRWDAEAGYASGDFSVALFGRNLLDEEYYTFINPQIDAGSPGDPRVFGVRARLAF